MYAPVRCAAVTWANRRSAQFRALATIEISKRAMSYDNSELGIWLTQNQRKSESFLDMYHGIQGTAGYQICPENTMRRRIGLLRLDYTRRTALWKQIEEHIVILEPKNT